MCDVGPDKPDTLINQRLSAQFQGDTVCIRIANRADPLSDAKLKIDKFDWTEINEVRDFHNPQFVGWD